MARDVQKQMSEAAIIGLRCKGDDWPRGLLSETPIPDTWMGLVVRPDGGRRFVPAGEDPQVKRDDTLVLVRNRAITVPIELRDIPADSAHSVDAKLEVLVRWLARDDDLAALHETLLTRDALTLSDLSDAMHTGGLTAAVRRFIQDQPAATLVHEDVRDALLAHLREQLKAFFFTVGLVLERIGQVEFTSSSLLREEADRRDTARRLRQMEARGQLEQVARAATQRRLDELGDVLDKLKTAAQGDERLRWRDLLPSLTPGERGRLLENLWRLTPNRSVATAIVVVAGRECAWLDPAHPARITRRLMLPDELGGLRSVTHDAERNSLLVGAATGVWRIAADDGNDSQAYRVPNLPEAPRTGFNAAHVRAGRLFATHSQLGVWSWDLDNPADVQNLLRPIGGKPRTIRAVTSDEHGRILIATDDMVQAFTADGDKQWQSGAADGAIHCLAPLGGQLYVGTSTGALQRCELVLPGEWIAVHRAFGPIESICARRWDDLTELVIPAAERGISGIYAEEGLVSQLVASPVPIRRAWACDDTLVGLADARDRLLVLSGSQPARQGVDVPVARLLGWSVQDVCIVSSESAQRRHSDEEVAT